MSKRAPSTPSTSSRKKTKLASDQAVLDTYFRAANSTNGRQTTTTAAPSRQTHRNESSDVVSEEIFTPLESMNDAISHHTSWQDGHGTKQNPIQLDLGDEPNPQGSMVVSIPPSSHDRFASPPDPCEKTTASLPSRRQTNLGLAFPPTEPDIDYCPVAVDPLVYPIHECPWPVTSPAPYSFLVHTLTVLVNTRSRIAILDVLTNTLRCLILYHPTSLLPALYLLSNSLSPAYSPLELGIGASVISRAIRHVSGLTSGALRRLYNSSGDPGDVAFEAKSNVRTLVAHPPLLIEDVYQSMLNIAYIKGQGAARQKQSIVERLLVAARGEETRFLVRTLSQNLRVGAVRTSILTALARALVLSPPPNPSIPIQSDSSLHVTPQFVVSIQPSSGKQKKNNDPQHNELLLKFANAEALVKQVYVQHPNYDHIVAGVIAGGLDGLPTRVPLTVGIPLHPTLGSPARSLDEIYERLNDMPFTAEFKYDGQRAQIHASKVVDGFPSVHIFSRHLENMTDKYPDVVSLVRSMFAKASYLQSFIIDSEIVAIDPDDGGLRSFQDLSSRARKDVEIRDIKVPVCVFAFDLMYLDGEIFLERSFRERRQLLRTRFPALTPGEPGTALFAHVHSCESSQGRKCIEAFWKEAVESRCEGLMIKLLDNVENITTHHNGKTRKRPLPATYEPDKRTSAWLKLKKDYVDGLGDTLDLVPVGAWHGNGRKAGWWSPVLLAVWDPTKGRLIAVCKCMSGDAHSKQDLTLRYSQGTDECSDYPLGDYDVGGFKPDVYFKPRQVWEIRGADITLSPVSLAALGQVSSTRGLSLRFPRFVRVREDKRPEHASTTQFLAQMYRDQQSRGKGTTGADDGDLMDMDVEVETQIEDESDG
ncbi:ATP-dependent DNA ligase [Boletus edulis BED1]|uniref:DNA ligase n=1 Tax=Boletus edulis BED1 TaxID=1328754 RepID=A0AAD4BVY7_BOLED|nr:ATP-dependent DNA ligase [Boletus edulis BED1]